MKKILLMLTAAVLIYSCSNSDNEAKRKALQKYKQQQHELAQKIEALEKDLEGTQTVEIVDVKATEINKQEFEHFIEVNGDVEAVNDVNVSPESAGVIEDIFVKEGQHVNKGDLLATLRTDVLQRSIDQLQVQLDLATTNFNRQKNLWEQNIGSEMQYLQAKTNMESLQKQIDALKAQMEMSDITSPINGVIDVVYQKKGQIGSPQSPFAKVVNNDEIKIYGDVSENYLTKVKNGDVVKVFFPAINKEVETPIRQIGSVIDENNRTFRIRLNINNPSGLIKPNLVAIIKIRDYFAKDAIVIPTLYVKEDFNGKYTYITDKEGDKNVAKKVYVTTGVTNNNMTEITSGLSEGMKIISEGYNQVVDGSVIRF